MQKRDWHEYPLMRNSSREIDGEKKTMTSEKSLIRTLGIFTKVRRVKHWTQTASTQQTYSKWAWKLKMAEEATARKEEKTPNLDFEDMIALRDDTISDFEISFDREAELREENERRVAEQAYDAVGATASAGIQEDEELPSSSRSVLRQFLKSSKPVVKAVATSGGTAKGGSIGGLKASKLTDAIIPDEDEEEKPSKIKTNAKN